MKREPAQAVMKCGQICSSSILFVLCNCDKFDKLIEHMHINKFIKEHLDFIRMMLISWPADIQCALAKTTQFLRLMGLGLYIRNFLLL